MPEFPQLKLIIKKEFNSWWGIASGIAVIATITGFNLLSLSVIYTIIIVGFIIILFMARVMYKVIGTLEKCKPGPKGPRKSISTALTDTDVEFAIYYLKKKITQSNFLDLEYLFTWEDITESENKQLINFLVKNQPLDWIRHPKVKNDNNIITISEGANSCSLKLNEEKNNAILKIANSKNYEFPAIQENQKHKIYRYDPKKNIIIGVDRGGAIVGGMLAKNLGLAISTLAISYANPPKSNLKNIDFSIIKKILLVDDAIRKGGTMAAAFKIVRQEWERQERYLFSWDEIQRKDDTKFLEFLTQNYEVNLAKTAKIQPNDDETVNISDGNNQIFFRLNHERTGVSLTINNVIDNEFIVRRERRKLNIYKIINNKIDDGAVRTTCILHQSGSKITPYYDVYNTNTLVIG